MRFPPLDAQNDPVGTRGALEAREARGPKIVICRHSGPGLHRIVAESNLLIRFGFSGFRIFRFFRFPVSKSVRSGSFRFSRFALNLFEPHVDISGGFFFFDSGKFGNPILFAKALFSIPNPHFQAHEIRKYICFAHRV